MSTVSAPARPGRPVIYKAWVSRAGLPTAIPDPAGDLVQLADYNALETQLIEANTALAALKVHDENVKKAVDASA